MLACDLTDEQKLARDSTYISKTFDKVTRDSNKEKKIIEKIHM